MPIIKNGQISENNYTIDFGPDAIKDGEDLIEFASKEDRIFEKKFERVIKKPRENYMFSINSKSKYHIEVHLSCINLTMLKLYKKGIRIYREVIEDIGDRVKFEMNTGDIVTLSQFMSLANLTFSKEVDNNIYIETGYFMKTQSMVIEESNDLYIALSMSNKEELRSGED